jgi:hypothetical protein
VQFDDGAVEGGQGVVQRPGVVRERPGVDDDGVGPAPGTMNDVDERPLVIGLVVLDDKPVPAGLLSCSGDVVGERRRPVDLWFSIAEEVEVGSR